MAKRHANHLLSPDAHEISTHLARDQKLRLKFDRLTLGMKKEKNDFNSLKKNIFKFVISSQLNNNDIVIVRKK